MLNGQGRDGYGSGIPRTILPEVCQATYPMRTTKLLPITITLIHSYPYAYCDEVGWVGAMVLSKAIIPSTKEDTVNKQAGEGERGEG